MDIRNLPLDDLVLDANLNLRDRLDDFSVERYADCWDRLPPITVFEVEGRWLLADGFHRHAAAIMLGKRTVPAEVREGTFADALDFVASVNLFHGLPLTRAERRRAVEVKLKLHHDWSDRRMAEELAVSRELVAKIRRQLIDGGQIPNSPGRVGADGKLYTSAGLPRDPNERLPTGKPIAQEDEPDERTGRRTGPGSGPREEQQPKAAASASAVMIAPRDSVPPWEDGGDYRTAALSTPTQSATPTIDEMLELMSRQIMEIVTWTTSDGFPEAFRGASSNARGVFHASVIKLAARSDQLRRG
jgi:hypothetical protein